MEKIINTIQRYHEGSLICLGGFLIFTMISLIIYKKLNIKEVFGAFRRIQMQKRMMILLLLCGNLVFGTTVYAMEVEQPEPLPEIPPIENIIRLEEFLVLPGSDLEENQFWTEDGETFFVKNLDAAADLQIHVGFLLEQGTFFPEKIALEYKNVDDQEWRRLPNAAQLWENTEEMRYETTYLFDGEENETKHYEFRIRYGENEEQTETLLQKYVLDKQAPAYEIFYRNEKGEMLETEGNVLTPYYNAAKNIHFQIHLTEENMDWEQSGIKLTGYDKKGQELYVISPEIVDGNAELLIEKDGHYKVEVYLIDRSGNEVFHEKGFALDFSPPLKPQITYIQEDGGILECVKDQLLFGYFSKNKITAQIQVEDAVSDVKTVSYSYQDLETEEIVTKTVEIEEGMCVVELPFSFKGQLKLSSKDLLGNESEIYEDVGIIAESEETHRNSSKSSVQIMTAAPKKEGYYAGDVKLRFSVRDTYSGVHFIRYLAGQEWDETVAFQEEGEIVTEELVREYEISAKHYNQNRVPIGLLWRDNAGYETVLSEEELTEVHIDTTAPIVDVIYDNMESENGRYYQKARTATVYVKERNFDPKDVKFQISGPEAELGLWSHVQGKDCTANDSPEHTGHSDDCQWKCEVKFSKDGEYSFGFSCVDFAGNEGSYGQTDEFIIDQTAPEIEVSYNHDVANHGLYYSDTRIATIVIYEANFSAEEVEIILTAQTNGEELPTPQVSDWISSEERHQAVIVYDYDGEFTFDIEYTDLAGNEAEDYSIDYFIVDMTKPEIIIQGIENHSSNNGEVAPCITVTDMNYISGSMWYSLSGNETGVLQIEGENLYIPKGESIQLEDIPRIKEMDDLYYLTVGASDLAGNVSEVQIQFSVNRFGSVYLFDKKTENLAGEGGNYYTNKEIPLNITEINVDTLQFQEIVCSLNGELRTLHKDIDYAVKVEGDESGWKWYQYELFADNFAEEGHYVVTVYSEDRANNMSDNQSKGKSLAFAVDKTSPNIIISGIEAYGRYRKNEQKIIIDVEDQMALQEVKVYLNGEAYTSEQERLELLVPSSREWQSLKVYGIDKAGNEVYSEEIHFLITPNLWIQFYQNKTLFYSTMAILTVSAAAITVFLCYKRKSS